MVEDAVTDSDARPTLPSARRFTSTTREVILQQEQGVLPLTLEVLVRENISGQLVPVADALVHALLYFNMSSDPGDYLERKEGETDSNGKLTLSLSMGGTVHISATTQQRCASSWIQHLAGGVQEVQLLLDKAITVHGRVTNAVTGLPIHGADVTFVNNMLNPVHTDAQGHFALGPWRFGSSSTLYAQAEGYGTERVRLIVEEDGAWNLPARFGHPPLEGARPNEPFVELVLVPEKVIVGRVVDMDAEPVADARVEAIGLYSIVENALTEDQAACQTDGQGLFLLDGLRSDITHAVGVGALGRRTTVVFGTGAGLQEAGDVMLESETSLRGSILDQGNRPMAGVLVELVQFAPTDRTPNLSPQNGRNLNRDGWSLQSLFNWETFSDTQGHFVFSGVPRGLVRLRVRPGDRLSAKSDIEITEPTTDVEPFVVKQELYQWSGIVMRGLEPVAGADIEIRALKNPFRALGKTDTKGHFYVSGVELETSYEVRAYLAPAEDQTPAYQNQVTFDGAPLHIGL